MKKTKKFTISIIMADKTLKGEGDTALEALQSIKVPDKIISKGILTIKSEGKSKEMYFPVPKLRRLFYPNAQPIIIKWVEAGLK